MRRPFLLLTCLTLSSAYADDSSIAPANRTSLDMTVQLPDLIYSQAANLSLSAADLLRTDEITGTVRGDQVRGAVAETIHGHAIETWTVESFADTMPENATNLGSSEANTQQDVLGMQINWDQEPSDLWIVPVESNAQVNDARSQADLLEGRYDEWRNSVTGRGLLFEQVSPLPAPLTGNAAELMGMNPADLENPHDYLNPPHNDDDQ